MQTALLLSCALLLIGFALRQTIKPLAALYIPAAVVAGVLGLLLVQFKLAYAVVSVDDWKRWRDVLVPIIFAGLLLDRASAKAQAGGDAKAVGQQTIAAWIIILGQLSLGLIVAWLLLKPAFGVPTHFGQLLEVSWAGGYGSSNAWGSQHDRIGVFPEARDLANFFTTAGLLWGVVSGIAIVNIGIRRGWTAKDIHVDEPIDAGPPSPAARTVSNSIEPLTLQIVWLAMAFGVGWLLQELIRRGAVRLDETNAVRQSLDKLPLFLLTLIGGWIVRRTLQFFRHDHLIDSALLARLVGAALDFLIFTAIATLAPETIRQHVVPTAILLIVGAVWTAFAVFWLSPRILPRRCWFELGILNYGFATATTPQGMMLLRMIDPHLRGDAPKIYALAAPATAMFIGGGVLTYFIPLALERGLSGIVIAVAVVTLVLLYVIGQRLQLRN
jgi:ESS family glutamate:Na+ symporter